MQRATAPTTCHLLRILGLAFGLAAVVGAMVGQGILRTPGIVAANGHSPAIILSLWVVGGLLAMVSAFAYVEMGAAIPCAGGPYDYVGRAFGPVAGAVAGWGGWLILVTAQSMLAIVVGEFLQRLGFLATVKPATIGLGILFLFWLVNLAGTRVSGASQILFSTVKGVALLALVGLLLILPSGEPRAATPISEPVTILGLAVAMRFIVSTYAGWDNFVFFGEELSDPGRDVPRAMFVGILSVAALYILVNVALLHVLSPSEMATSNLPGADAAARVMGTEAERAITVFGVLSVAAITNLKMMGSARAAFALCRGGALPKSLATVAPNGTPRPALAVSVLTAALFMLLSDTYAAIIAVNTGITVAVVLMANAAAIRLRLSEPDLPRPFKMPLFPLPAILAILINGGLLVAFAMEDPVHSLVGLAIMVAIGLIFAWTHSGRVTRPGVAA